jgi:DNA-3-methyladenine glycosylase II
LDCGFSLFCHPEATELIRLTRPVMKQALEELSARDPDIARAYAQVGVPPMRARPTGFPTLVRAIVAQQVSVASARAIIGRLEAATDGLDPQAMLALDDEGMRAVGMSRQKVIYVRELATAVLNREVSFRRIAMSDDETAIADLTRIKGIGRWTAEVYLLFAHRRPDIWPVDDLAVVVGLQRLKGLPDRPDRKQMLSMGEDWRPWRSAAARICWHYYSSAPPA